MTASKNTLVFLVCTFAATVAAAASPAGSTRRPATNPLIQRLTAKAGAARAGSIDGVLKLDVTTEETTLDGKSHKGGYTAWVNPSSWIQRRMKISPTVIVGFDGKAGWATINGKNDTRPQTSLQAVGTIDRYLFPLLLPFSLQTPGIVVGKPRPATWEKNPAVQLPLSFPSNFFYSPVMDTQWILTLDPKKEKVLGAEFRSPEEYARLGAEGMRYYILKRTVVDGVTLPTKLLAVAIDRDGNESGHVKVYSVKVTRVPGDASLFLSPTALAAIGEGDS
ncbi:MAG: hypothetical protein GXP47_03225 [Acidobacteria bacterium]|nr:hypothetical protein [Acidobacteriota bacterium]